MNQSVAPTSFITSTSRRRENSDRRIVFEISSTEANTSSAAEQRHRELDHARGREDRVRLRLAVLHRRDRRVGDQARAERARLVELGAQRARRRSGWSGVTRKMSGSGL